MPTIPVPWTRSLKATVESDDGLTFKVDGQGCRITKKAWKTHVGGDIIETIHCKTLIATKEEHQPEV